jgi:hypothetical protein
VFCFGVVDVPAISARRPSNPENAQQYGKQREFEKPVECHATLFLFPSRRALSEWLGGNALLETFTIAFIALRSTPMLRGLRSFHGEVSWAQPYHGPHRRR